MNLTPREKDKLLISMAAMVARRRRERGVKLNHPEAGALITDFIVEGARAGKTVPDLIEAGARAAAPGGGRGGGTVPTRGGVREGHAKMSHHMRAEARFRDETKRGTGQEPIR